MTGATQVFERVDSHMPQANKTRRTSEWVLRDSATEEEAQATFRRPTASTITERDTRSAFRSGVKHGALPSDGSFSLAKSIFPDQITNAGRCRSFQHTTSTYLLTLHSHRRNRSSLTLCVSQREAKSRRKY